MKQISSVTIWKYFSASFWEAPDGRVFHVMLQRASDVSVVGIKNFMKLQNISKQYATVHALFTGI
jgi:hypothetical protein